MTIECHLNSVELHRGSSLGGIRSQAEFGVVGRKELLEREPESQELVPLRVSGQLARVLSLGKLPHDGVQLEGFLLQLHEPDVLGVADEHAVEVDRGWASLAS